MGVVDEPTDKSGKSKPPLLPKPNYSATSSGADVPAVPQMIITSADDVTEVPSSEPTISVPVAFDVETKDSSAQSETISSSVDAKKEPTTEDVRVEVPHIESVIQEKSEVREESTSEPVPIKVEQKPSEVTHSFAQRPLVFESEKPVLEHGESKGSVSSSLSTRQRPLVFDDTKIPSEVPICVTPDSEKSDTCFHSEDEDIQRHEGETTPETAFDKDVKPKSSSFSWLPSFPKVSAGTKEAKSVEDIKCSEPTTSGKSPESSKKEGLFNVPKFFARHEPTTDATPKDMDAQKDSVDGKGLFNVPKIFARHEPSTDSTPKETEAQKDSVDAKGHHKDAKQSIKNFFGSFKHETNVEPKDDASKLAELSKEVEKKGEQKDKHGIKKFFDSFKHDAATEPKPTEPEDSKHEHKDAMQSVKQFFDSFKHDSDDSKVKQPKTTSTELQDKTVESDISKSTEVKPQDEKGIKEVEPSKKQDDSSKSGLKTFFGSFRHDQTSEPKTKPTKTGEEKLEIDKPKEQHKLDISKSSEAKPQAEKGSKEAEPSKMQDDSSKSGLKTFFGSFRHDQTSEPKTKSTKTDGEKLETEKPKDGLHSIKKFFDTLGQEELGSKKVKAPKDQKEVKEQEEKEKPGTKTSDLVMQEKKSAAVQPPTITISDAEQPQATPESKDGFRGVKKMFGSFTQKDISKPATEKIQKKQASKQTDHIYDVVGAPTSSMSAEQKEIPKKEATSPKHKEGPSGVKKLFDSFRHKDPADKPKVVKREPEKVEGIYDEICPPDDKHASTSPKTKDVPKVASTSKEATSNVPAEPTRSPKPGISSLRPVFGMKDKKQQPKQDITIHDLQKPQSSKEPPKQIDTKPTVPSVSIEPPKPIDKTEPMKAPRATIEADVKFEPRSPESSKPKVEPGTPESLYDTCCLRLAVLLQHKAMEIVDHTKSPPKKPPKPSAETIAKARADAVARRLQELQKKGNHFGDNIPVGIDGIRYADEETESSCDYKDVENFDYIMDYELINRYKFDNKLDTFSIPSSVTSYYTADTVTLKDELFSETMETISLGSSDSYRFKHANGTKDDVFHDASSKSLHTSPDRLKQNLNLSPGKKKVPPPLPPKPVLSPKYLASRKLRSEASSSCVNGLSLSPRFERKVTSDSAGIQKRPLVVADIKTTEFSSLPSKGKLGQKSARTFDTVLKNESLKSVPNISSGHPTLSPTKSSPPCLETSQSDTSSLSRKLSPPRPPPPIFSAKPDLKKSPEVPIAPEKPKREGIPAHSGTKRTGSPPRPPPSFKMTVRPPRPPPPALPVSPLAPLVSSEQSRQETPNICVKQEPVEASFKLTEAKSESVSTTYTGKKTEDVALNEGQHIQDTPKSEFPSTEPAKLPDDAQDLKTAGASLSNIQIAIETEVQPEQKPTRPPRGRRIRSRTVEIRPAEKESEPRKRRSQSLTETDIEKRVESANLEPLERSELKSLYTTVNKEKKHTANLATPGLEARSSSLENVATRPLPAPPPPPRKFRSLDRKPKQKKDETQAQKQDEAVPYETSSLRPPARKRKTEKHRFLSLSNLDRKPEEFVPQEQMSRSSSVPVKPERKRHIVETRYDENANVEISETDASDVIDKATNANLEQNIPAAATSESKTENKKSQDDKKSRSSWYDESVPKEDTWEVLDWTSTDEETMSRLKKRSNVSLRRKSDPIKKTRQTSTFYVDFKQMEAKHASAPPLVDKETSPLPLDCSEKSVQTSLETLSSRPMTSCEEREEQSEDNTEELLDLAQTLQNELKIIINRHKSISEVDDDIPTPPLSADDTRKDLMGEEKKSRRGDSVRSSTSDMWQMTSSEESDGEMPQGASANLTEAAMTRKQKKIFYVAQEIMTSEEMFVDALKLLNVDFKAAVESANKQRNSRIIPDEVLAQILNHLPQLQHLNENLLMELKDRIANWDKNNKIADVIVKMGPFLKLYSWFIHDFESNVSLLEESKKKYPSFAQVVKEFEMSSRCRRLALNHFMLKPIQRIPQYRLLLQEYLHHLPEDSPDYQDTQAALQIVSEVANHANDSMKQGDNAQKLISIQNSIMGHKEIIKPGRTFVKEGELMKLSRKGMQPRWFVLFNDILLYLTPVQQGLYRVNHELALTGMKVAIPIQQDYQNEFSIISVTRSFTLAAKSPEERQEWIIALTKAIEENASKRSTFTNVRLQQKAQERSSEEDDGAFVLGKKAPVWIPDARVTMCQLCTSEFTVTFRRHHCRACGKVVCSICSSNRISLPYLGNRIARVCDECYTRLGPGSGCCTESGETDSDNQQLALKSHLRTDHRHNKKGKRNLPSVLKEVCANDQGSTISGYLQKKSGKSWKRDWFVVKDKVLYEYKASEDIAALRSIPLLGYEIEHFTESYENIDSSLLFQLAHPGQSPIIFHADTVGSAERWVAALKEATVLE